VETLDISVDPKKEEFCDIEGEVASGLAMNEGKCKKSAFREMKSHLFIAQEKAQLEVQSGKQLSLEGVPKVSLTLAICSK
jgi:hypothetical protein